VLGRGAAALQRRKSPSAYARRSERPRADAVVPRHAGEDIESVLRRVIVRGRLIQRRGRERSDRPACRLVEFGAAGVRSITGYDRVGEARAAARGEGDG